MFDFKSLQSDANQTERIAVRRRRPPSPPVDAEEWLQREGIGDFPFPPAEFDRGGEYSLNYSAPKTVEELVDELTTQAAEFDPVTLETLDNKLANLQHRISELAILHLPAKGTGSVRVASENSCSYDRRLSKLLSLTPNTGKLLSTEGSPAEGNVQSANNFLSAPRTVQMIKFPGFSSHELTPLPAHAEPRHILDVVSKAQKLPGSFLKEWKRLFLSEASCAVLQDTFWWVFLNTFCPDPDTQDRLFGRIADSFAALFLGEKHSAKRDRFFHLYPHCLAQGVLMTFCKTFPASIFSFDDQFKTDLADLTWLWISGVTCPLQYSWKTWPLADLSAIPPTAPPIPSGAASLAHVHAMKQLRVPKLPTATPPGSRHRSAKSAKSLHHSTSIENTGELTSRQDSRAQVAFSPEPAQMRSEKMAQASSEQSQFKPARTESLQEKSSTRYQNSHLIGPGPEYQRVMFNTAGRCPLINYYLVSHGYEGAMDTDLTRTEVTCEQQGSVTYAEAVDDTKRIAARMEADYEKAVHELAATHRAKLEQFAIEKELIDRDCAEKVAEVYQARQRARKAYLIGDIEN